MSFVSSYNGGSILISACISNYDEDENCATCTCRMLLQHLLQTRCRDQRHDNPMPSQVGHTLPGLQHQHCLAPDLMRGGVIALDFQNTEWNANVCVMSWRGLLWIVTRKCSHNLWDRERRQTETGGWHVMMWGVLTQLSTRLSTFTFYSKGCHPFRWQHSLSSHDRLTVNYLHFWYWNLIIIDNVSMKWLIMNEVSL